jgi:hypothetical protein
MRALAYASCDRCRGGDLLQAMMSSTKTMNPTMPPPVPACHGFALIAEMGAASASMKNESWSRAAMTKLNILAVFMRVLWGEEYAAGCER